MKIAFLLLGIALAGDCLADSTPIKLIDSFKPVAEMPANGAINPRTAYISRSTLSASESSATMRFEVALKMRNFAELQARVNLGEHVSAEEMVAKYDPLQTDYQATIDWLTSQGLTITRRDGHHMAIFVSGTVSQIQQATQAKFARVTLQGVEYTSAITAPSAPSSLTPLLVGINGLQPHLAMHKHIKHPNASSSTAVYTPAQIAQAYQANGLYNSNINGAGQTIAIVIDTFPAKEDLIGFWTGFGVNQTINNIQFIQAVSGTLPAPSGEETLDTEWSSAMAPGAKVRVYAATDLANNDLDAAYQQVFDDVTAHPAFNIHQMSMSYGAGEVETTNAQMQTDDQYFVELTNAGVTCFGSSGDEGSTPGQDAQGNPNESGFLEAESPASDPNVIGVGGTSLTLNANNTESTEVVWNNSIGASGGGTSVYFSRPAWQTGTGVPNVTNRLVPDISCSADPDFGADTVFEGGVSASGGTSWASPTCAGFCALINQARANVGLPAIGELGPHIYPLIGTANFRDITSGNNATPLSIQSYGSKYSATTGYDEATGIGVPLMQTLTQTLASTSTLVGVGQTSTLETVNLGQTATITAVATGSPVSFQWQRMPIGSSTWSNLSDTGAYSGSTTTALTVSNTTVAMSGDQFQCVVTYSGVGTITSAKPTALIVETPWVISTLAGNSTTAGLVNNTGTAAEFFYPSGIAIDSTGNLYVADLDNNVIRKVTPAGVVTTPYGSLSGTAGTTNGSGNTALFNAPRDITIDSSNNLYVSDEGSNHIRKITTSTGQVTTIGTAASPAFNLPKGICVDSSFNVYVADSGNNVIRKIATSGAVTIVAGSSSFTAGYANGSATGAALFNEPIGLAVDSSGALYVTEYYNEVVRKISGGQVTLLAGQPGIAGCLDGTGSQALFNVPRGIMIDGSGNLYVTDSYAPLNSPPPDLAGNNLLRKISPAGVVTTLAGQAGVGGSVDQVGSGALFYNPCGLAMNSSGQIYIADASNNTIRLALPTAVSVSATVPYAAINGPVDGQFTVTRVGNTSGTLAVNYSLTNSTAISDTDYTALPGSVTLTDGASTATIAVIPKVNPQAMTNRTVELTLTSSATGVSVNTTPAIVTISQAPAVAYGQWQTNNSFFGAESAMPFNDSVPNLLKYFFDINPNAPISGGDRPVLPTMGMATIGGTDYVTLTYREYASATGVTVNVQTSFDLQTWLTATNSMITPVGIDRTTGDPIMQAQVPYTATPQFIRLDVVGP